MTRFCLKCGSPLPPNSAQCPHCHTAVSAVKPAAPVPAPRPAPSDDPANRAIRGGCFSIVILVSLLLGWAGWWCLSQAWTDHQFRRENPRPTVVRYEDLDTSRPLKPRLYHVTGCLIDLSYARITVSAKNDEIHSVTAPLVSRNAPGMHPFRLLVTTSDKEICAAARRVQVWREEAPLPEGFIAGDDGAFLFPHDVEGMTQPRSEYTATQQEQISGLLQSAVAPDWTMVDQSTIPHLSFIILMYGVGSGCFLLIFWGWYRLLIPTASTTK